jgi:hypothetical protein
LQARAAADRDPEDRRAERDRLRLAIGARGTREGEHCLGDDRRRGRRQTGEQPGEPAAGGDAAAQFERLQSEPEGRHRDGRGQGEADPGRQRPAGAGPHEADQHPGLARRRARQHRAERDDRGEGALIEPLPALDEFAAEVADVRDRAAERRESETQEDPEDVAHPALGVRRPSKRARPSRDSGYPA